MMEFQEVYKINLIGTDKYMGYSKNEFSDEFGKQKLYVSRESVTKVQKELSSKGYDVEVECFRLTNRKSLLKDLVENL